MSSMRRGVCALAACVALAACGGASSSHSAPSPPIGLVHPETEAPAPPPVPPLPKLKRPPAPPPGTLPQTNALPSADTPGFQREMAKLWAGIVANSVGKALPAFFPEAAYLQLKTVGDPKGDFEDRLVGDFRLDLGASHALAGTGAKLMSVQVPAAYAHWVPPGVCDNRVGYYEVPNSRIVYSQAGAVHSFGIASMISWRGVWYVIHLGSVLRPVVEGVVDSPAAGPGVSEPSSTC